MCYISLLLVFFVKTDLTVNNTQLLHSHVFSSFVYPMPETQLLGFEGHRVLKGETT